jgi:hypothetical protein
VLVDFSRNPTGFNLAFGEGGHRVIEIDVIPGHVPEPADEAVK